MDPITIAGLALLFFLAALLYSSVGHAGASAYLAAMILVGVPTEIMKPTAFTLNIFVATLVTLRFQRHGHFDWQRFWPFATASVPAAFLASYAKIPQEWFRLALVLLMVLAALRLLLARPDQQPIWNVPFSTPLAWIVGMCIGTLSGMTGTGGGIFLSPVLLFLGWADARKTAGISAAFILVNSIAGLAGSIASTRHIPEAILLWVPVVASGAWLGTQLGIKRFSPVILLRALGVVLLFAVIKLIWG
ncbi:MAG: sulfite exporter TauE/SafE family protein [Gemmataceae bacterium]